MSDCPDLPSTCEGLSACCDRKYDTCANSLLSFETKIESPNGSNNLTGPTNSTD
ncbi:4814_t:CDS:2 [Ambispora leptoticha]|uniref:4814_t:CDS:1 n=1 Tax=Ambispora leptoticha TaxID=144679 RepID=A0A9N9BV76_9GLOM|nr:4814_t:CDS:2 [Ambispora leptoticha]